MLAGLAAAAGVCGVTLAGLAMLDVSPAGLVAATLGLVAASLVGLLALAVGQARRRPGLNDVRQWRAIGDALPFSWCVVERSGRSVQANEGFRRLLPGAKHAPLAALRARLGADGAAGGKIAKLADAGGGGAAEVLAMARPGGGVDWLRVATYPLGGPKGQVLWVIQDVTVEREMEQVIREEQSKVVDVLEHAPIGFYSADGDGRFLLVNRTLTDWLGTDAQDIKAGDLRLHDFLAVRPPAGTPPYSPIAGSAEEPYSGEVALRARDGRVIAAHIDQAVVRDGTDGTLRTRSAVRNLAAAGSRRRSGGAKGFHFERIFEDAPVGIVLLDAEGRVIDCNRAWRHLVATGEAEVEGRRLAEFLVPSETDKVASWLARVASDPGPALDATLKAKADESRNRVTTMLANRLAEGDEDSCELIVFCFDTTEQKNLEQRFTQGQKMQAVGQLAGGIAHDFNNLLTAMIGFCDLLMLRHTPGDQSFADIMQIKQNANRAANLVGQLLAFSRQQTLQPRVLNVTDALADLSNLLRRLLGANIEFNMVHGRDLGSVRVDQGQLEQVIINLAVNARDAMAGGGTLAIRTENLALSRPMRRQEETVPPGDYVVISIGDTGSGIAPENLPHIFEPFFTTKGVGKGTGLGLATAYGIVKQTGGFLLVDSDVAKGTIFTIYLPQHAAAEAGERPVAESGEGPDLTGAGTVLLVEDEDAVRRFSARALRTKGYKVHEARTGEQALELLADLDGPIDLLITDVVMPQMDGSALIKEVRQARGNLRVICISGYAEDALRQRLGEAGDVHFLAKPFSLAELAGKVKEVLARPAPYTNGP